MRKCSTQQGKVSAEKNKFRKSFVMETQEVEYFKKAGEVNDIKCCSESNELRTEKMLIEFNNPHVTGL